MSSYHVHLSLILCYRPLLEHQYPLCKFNGNIHESAATELWEKNLFNGFVGGLNSTQNCQWKESVYFRVSAKTLFLVWHYSSLGGGQKQHDDMFYIRNIHSGRKIKHISVPSVTNVSSTIQTTSTGLSPWGGKCLSPRIMHTLCKTACSLHSNRRDTADSYLESRLHHKSHQMTTSHCS